MFEMISMSQIVFFYISIFLYISTHNNNRNSNMPHYRGGRLVSEIGTGGHGGRNIIGDENQNWCSSKIPFHPHKTITSTIEPESQLNWSHLINHQSLLKLLHEDTCCKSCVNILSL